MPRSMIIKFTHRLRSLGKRKSNHQTVTNHPSLDSGTYMIADRAVPGPQVPEPGTSDNAELYQRMLNTGVEFLNLETSLRLGNQSKNTQSTKRIGSEIYEYEFILTEETPQEHLASPEPEDQQSALPARLLQTSEAGTVSAVVSQDQVQQAPVPRARLTNRLLKSSTQEQEIYAPQQQQPSTQEYDDVEAQEQASERSKQTSSRVSTPTPQKRNLAYKALLNGSAADLEQNLITQQPLDQNYRHQPEQQPTEQILQHQLEQQPTEQIIQHQLEQQPTEQILQHQLEQQPTQQIYQHQLEQQPTQQIHQHQPEQQPTQQIHQHQPEQQPTEQILQHRPEQQPTEQIHQHQPEQQPTEQIRQHQPEQQPTEQIHQHQPEQQPTEQIRQHLLEQQAWHVPEEVTEPNCQQYQRQMTVKIRQSVQQPKPAVRTSLLHVNPSTAVQLTPVRRDEVAYPGVHRGTPSTSSSARAVARYKDRKAVANAGNGYKRLQSGPINIIGHGNVLRVQASVLPHRSS